MDAVILAAGRGSRLRPITDSIHKSLLRVGDTKIIESQIKSYVDIGVDTIHVITGYRGKEVEECISKIKHDIGNYVTINVIQSKIWQSTDNLYSLYLTERYVRGDSFILSNADVFAERNIFEDMCTEPQRAIVPYDSQNFDSEALILALREGRPSAILDKGSQNGAGATIGMFSFSRRASEALFADLNSHIDVESEKTQWFESSLDRIFSDINFEAIDISNHTWIEIDSVDDLKSAWDDWVGDRLKFKKYVESISGMD
jgi:choline kinase